MSSLSLDQMQGQCNDLNEELIKEGMGHLVVYPKSQVDELIRTLKEVDHLIGEKPMIHLLH